MAAFGGPKTPGVVFVSVLVVGRSLKLQRDAKVFWVVQHGSPQRRVLLLSLQQGGGMGK